MIWVFRIIKYSLSLNVKLVEFEKTCTERNVCAVYLNCKIILVLFFLKSG